MSFSINFLAFLLLLASPFIFIQNQTEVNIQANCSYYSVLEARCLDDDEAMQYNVGTCEARYKGNCLDDWNLGEF